MKLKTLYLLTILVLFAEQHGYGQKNKLKLQVDSLQFLGTDAFNCNSILWKIVANKNEAIPFLINKIIDTTITKSRDKCKKANLRVGDLAYIALEQIIPLPFFAVTGMQCDVFDEEGCQLGIYEYVESNRQKFKTQVQAWYNKKATTFKWIRYNKKELTDCYRKNKIYGRYEYN